MKNIKKIKVTLGKDKGFEAEDIPPQSLVLLLVFFLLVIIIGVTAGTDIFKNIHSWLNQILIIRWVA